MKGSKADSIYIDELVKEEFEYTELVLTDIQIESRLKYIKHMEYDNPFKSEDWNNPGRTIEESTIRMQDKVNKIKE